MSLETGETRTANVAYETHCTVCDRWIDVTIESQTPAQHKWIKCGGCQHINWVEPERATQ